MDYVERNDQLAEQIQPKANLDAAVLKERKEEKKHNHKVQPGEKVVVRVAKKFGQRGAYVYLPNLWMGERVKITLYHNSNTCR